MTTAGVSCAHGVVVTWITHHGRSERLAEHAGLRAVFMPWALPRRVLPRQVVSWSRSAARTWHVVRALPPGAVVVAVSPPVFNPLVCVAAAGRRHRVVIDAHSGTFNDNRWRWSHPLVRACARRCAAVLVTNAAVGREVLGDHARLIVLHDPLLDRNPCSQTVRPQRRDRPYVLFPASGAPDEPIAAVVQAADLLADDVDVIVTGRIGSPPRGSVAHFTGYLPQQSYRDTLQRADAVLALTTREGTMQRAAYEALEVGTRLICSDTAALRATFGPVADYSPNEGESLAVVVRRSLARPRAECRVQERRLRKQLNAEGAAVLALLRTGVPEPSTPASTPGPS